MAHFKGLNPYRNAPVAAPAVPLQMKGGYEVTASGEPADQEFRGPGGDRMFAQGGEVNAWNKKDAAKNIRHFAAQASSGNLRQNYLDSVVPRHQRKQQLQAALHDQSMRQWSAIGAGIAQIVQERQQREGITRKVLNQHPLNLGEDAKITMPRKIAQAVISVSATNVEFQLLDTNKVYPTEVSLVGNLFIENLTLQQASGDLLEEAYNQLYESILVAEDRLLKTAYLSMVSSGMNPIVTLGTALSTGLLSQIKRRVTDHGLPVGALLMASDFWDDMLGNSAFYDLYDPVTRYNLIQDGTIGTVFGMPIITDSFRDQDYRILDPGQMFITASADYCGGFTDRGGVEATPVDGSAVGKDGRGWFGRQSFSLAVVNAKSIGEVLRA
jgi:hypothetical protein